MRRGGTSGARRHGPGSNSVPPRVAPAESRNVAGRQAPSYVGRMTLQSPDRVGPSTAINPLCVARPCDVGSHHGRCHSAGTTRNCRSRTRGRGCPRVRRGAACLSIRRRRWLPACLISRFCCRSSRLFGCLSPSIAKAPPRDPRPNWVSVGCVSGGDTLRHGTVRRLAFDPVDQVACVARRVGLEFQRMVGLGILDDGRGRCWRATRTVARVLALSTIRSWPASISSTGCRTRRRRRRDRGR